MRVLDGLMSRLKVMMLIIYWILEYHEDHTKWLTWTGDTLQSDVPSSWLVSKASSWYVSFDIQNIIF